MKHDILEVHASDNDSCLRRLHAEVVEGVDTDSVPAKLGRVLHAVAEAVTLELAEHPMADQRDVGAAAFTRHALLVGLGPHAIADGISILEGIFAQDSRMQFRMEMGWSGRPEVEWAIDHEFRIIADPAARKPGDAIAAGRIDLQMWTPTKVNGRVVDWKSDLGFRSSDDAYESFQLRMYSFATLLMIPEMQTVEGSFGMLRHRYFARADFLRGDPWQWGHEQKLRAIHEQRVRAADSGVWPETAGKWCKWCPIRFKCATYKARQDEGSMPPDLDRPELARRRDAHKVIAADYDDAIREAFAADDSPIPLGDARGTVLGYKPTAGWSCLHEYDETIARVRDLVPAGAWPTVFAENFRWVYEAHFASKVQKVLKSLKVSDDVMDTIVVPVTKTQLTTFRPDPPAAGEFVVEPDTIAQAMHADPERVRRILNGM